MTTPYLSGFLAFLIIVLATSAQSNITAQDATVFALLYGSPLLAFEKLAFDIVDNGGVDRLIHSRELSTADNRSVVRPNVDTLYSTAIFDLSHNDVIVTVPDIAEAQFALFSYYDPYGDNFANTGSGNLATAGQYRLRLRPEQSYGIEVLNGTSEPYVAYINSPSVYGTLLIRWLVNATNIDDVHAYQNATKIQPVPLPNNATRAPYLSLLLPLDSSANVFNLLPPLLAQDPPEDSSDESAVQQTLEEAGFKLNSYHGAPGVNLTAANLTAYVQVASAAAKASVPLNNGWSMINPDSTGDFGKDYALRAYVARTGYLMLRAPNAIYPSWSNASRNSSADTAGTISLGADEAIVYTFSGKPPLMSTGFWSLTAYEADQYLIPNDLDVYALGDRSNITYTDGRKIYGASANVSSAQDGPFQILVQPADVTPPANWTSNWLPGPAGGGNISVTLRWFGAQEALVDASYVYPVVSKRASIVGRNGTSGTSSSPIPSVNAAGGRVFGLYRASASALLTVLLPMLMA